MKNFSWLLLSSLVVGWSIPVHSAQIPVDLELAFLIDGSDSVSQSDFEAQIQAYQNIFRDNFFNRYVAALPNQKLAVAAFQFGGTNNTNGFEYLSEWRLITDQAAANLFADQFSGRLKLEGRTPIGFAIQSAANGNVQPPLSPPVSPDTPPSIPGIFNNAYSGFSAIDINSDGDDAPFLSPPFVTIADGSDYARCFGDLSNNCPNVDDVPNVLPGGVNVINYISQSFSQDLDEAIYGTNITGSTQNSFFYGTIGNFEATLRTKLDNEIGFTSTSVPEPNFTAGLLGFGLLSLGSRWFSRRK
jgi:hypothetical protein